MKGAIIGDIVGSIYEWHNIKTKEFPLFQQNCFFTDDSIMTCAVARAFLSRPESLEAFQTALVYQMRLFGYAYPHGGYGGRFKKWLRADNPKPYRSYGNGAAMRCSPAGWIAARCIPVAGNCDHICEIEEDAERLACATALPTHNHPEGIKAAVVTSVLIAQAQLGETIDEMRKYAASYYTIPVLDEIRPTYAFTETCQGTMPVALAAFFESTGFEDAIRNAISVGGDSDTIAAITGSIAEAYYGVPDEIWEQARQFLPVRLDNLVNSFYHLLETESIRKTHNAKAVKSN